MSGWNQLHRFGKALYDFAPAGDFQVPLKAGDSVEVFEESSGWYKGIVNSDPPAKGIFPASFVELLPENAVPPSAATPAPQPVQVGSEQDIPFYKRKLQRLQDQKMGTASPRGSNLSTSGSSGAASPRPSGNSTTLAVPGAQQTAASASAPRGAAASASVVKPTPPVHNNFKLSSAGQDSKTASSSPTSASSNAAAAPATATSTASHAPISHQITFEALFGEISSCITEWSASLELHIYGGNVGEYHRVKERMSALLELRSKIMNESDLHKREALREEIIQLIESSRKMQEGYMVPRNKEGEMADTTNTGMVELLALHRQMYSTLKEESSAVWRGATQRRRQSSVAAQHIESPTPERRSPFPPGNLQLFLDVKMCIFAVGEATELYFSLYSDKEKRFISEDFCVALTEAGMPEKISLLNKLTTLFKDLEAADFDGNLHLVCFIYRRGRIVYDASKKRDPSMNYRRPFGCAVLNLTTAGLEASLGKEYTPPPVLIFTPLPEKEDKFCAMHQLIIQKDMTNLQPAPKAKGIALGLTLFHGEEAAVRASKGDKLKVNEVPNTNKLDFPEVMKAGDTRNDLYVFLVGGRFNQDNKTSAKNIEVLVRVCNSRGDVVPDCIIRGSGGAVTPASEFHSSVYYHWNDPVFNECLRLRIDPDQLENCHLFFSFWHVSTTQKKNEKAFSFGFLKLTTESGAVIPDAEHVIQTFVPAGKEDVKNDAYYLKGDAAVPKLAARKNESFTLRTKLCSTKKTQNDTLHSLFKWRSLDINTLKLMLQKFLNINKGGFQELCKFVRETFDVFFGMLISPHHAPTHDAVFLAILHLLGVLTDRKLAQYRPMVDSYIGTIFNQPTVHHLLIKLCKKRMEECKSSLDAGLMQLCKCFNYVVKLIVASRTLDVKSAKPSCDDKTFKANLQDMLHHANALITLEDSKSHYLFGAQSYLVRGVPEIMDDLKVVFEPAELGAIARDVIAAVPNQELHTINKLNLIRQLLMGELGELPAARLTIFPIVMQNLKIYLRAVDLGSLGEPYLCVSILQRLLSIATSKRHVAEQNIWDFAPLLGDLLNCVLGVQEAHLGVRQMKPPNDTVTQSCKVDLLPDSITVLWGLLYALKPELVDKHIRALPVSELATFCMSLLSVCHNCLSLKLYAEMWIVMNMLQLAVISSSLKTLGEPIRTKLGPQAKDYAPDVWKKYFELSLGLLSIEALKIEKFSDSKKQFVLTRYGDIRVEVISDLHVMWKSLGVKQVAFCGHLTATLFDLAHNSSNPEAKAMALNMFYDMVSAEFSLNGEFSEVERHTIDSLYNIANISQDSGDKFMEFLYTTMKDRLSKDKNAKLAERGVAFLKHVAKMYELMSSLLKFPDTAVYEDERTSVALKLMTYLEESGHVRKEMAGRYVQYLVDLHIGLGNYIEAGMAQLYALRLLEWNDAPLETQEGSAGTAAEPERLRRERLYKGTIAHFVQGETFERAVVLCEELRKYYVDWFEYDALAALLREEAGYFEKISHLERFYYSYFRVVYHGAGFDEEIRNKEFVYRGCQLEAVMDFTNRIKKKFPTARILMSSDTPSQEMMDQTPTHQIISITTLTREKEESEKALEVKQQQQQAGTSTSTNKRVPPPNVQRYRHNNDLICFSFSKPVQKAKEKKPENEFKHLWVQKTFIYTAEAFPTNRRRVPVVSRKEIMVSPIENAVKTVLDKNDELSDKVEQVDTMPEGPVDVGPLSMLLNGMIDAAVNGGTQKYISAFLTDEFVKENPDASSAKFQQDLKEALHAQVDSLKTGLAVFGRRSGPELKGLFDHLSGFYGQMVAKTKPVLS